MPRSNPSARRGIAPMTLGRYSRRRVAALALAAALASCSEPEAPSQEAAGARAPGAGGGTIEVFYVESPEYEQLASLLAESGVFEGMAQSVTSVVALPADLPVVFTECGEPNAFYGDGRVVMCYEFF